MNPTEMAVLGAQRWTEEQDGVILETMPRTNDDVMRVARKLGRSPMTVRHRVLRFSKERILSHWTAHEMRLVEEAARLNREIGQLKGDARLRQVAEQIGRSYMAVRHMALLLDARSMVGIGRRVRRGRSRLHRRRVRERDGTGGAAPGPTRRSGPRLCN